MFMRVLCGNDCVDLVFEKCADASVSHRVWDPSRRFVCAFVDVIAGGRHL
jgi:hypothetical protein